MKLKNSIHLASPTKRKIGDIMPVYLDGYYHIFYLLNGSGNEDINHEHAITKDFCNYEFVNPSLKHTKEVTDYLHNGCIFTGCYLKIAGLYHTYFTSYNPNNPEGREFILHRVSDTLEFNLEKEEVIAPDGHQFSQAINRDFRDPAVYYNEELKRYEMFLLANLVEDTSFVYALYTSNTPYNFQPDLLISKDGDECPSLFIGKKYYFIHGCHRYIYSKKRLSGYKVGKFNNVDLPFCRAAKLVDDGTNTLWLGGWINGKMSIPRITNSYKKIMTFKFYYPLEKHFKFYKEEYEEVLVENRPYLVDFKLKNGQSIDLISKEEKVVIELKNKKVRFTINSKEYERRIPFLWKKLQVKLLLEEDMVEVFLNKRVVITIPLRKSELRKIVVKNNLIVVREWREEL